MRRLRLADEAPSAPAEPRPFLDLVPYFALMFGLAVLALAIIVMAWPGRQAQPAPSAPPPAEVGTAPKGWMDSDTPARS